MVLLLRGRKAAEEHLLPAVQFSCSPLQGRQLRGALVAVCVRVQKSCNSSAGALSAGIRAAAVDAAQACLLDISAQCCSDSRMRFTGHVCMHEAYGPIRAARAALGHCCGCCLLRCDVSPRVCWCGAAVAMFVLGFPGRLAEGQVDREYAVRRAPRVCPEQHPEAGVQPVGPTPVP
jgi:hypothetical protein